MQEDPFAAFKPSDSSVENILVEKKKRGRKAKLKERAVIVEKQAATAAKLTPFVDDLEALAKIVLILTPFSRKDQNRILKAVSTVMDRP